MEFSEYERIYDEAAHGAPRCGRIRQALDMALEQADIENALRLYYVFIEEDTFYSDNFQSVILFPEYLDLFEKYPQYHEQFSYYLMWAFKWISSSAADFYQISLQQITDIYRQYGEYCDKLHYNKRSYYRKIWCLMNNHGIRNFMLCPDCEEAHRLMMHCPKDELSEVKAGEADDLTSYYLEVEKDIHKALKAAEPILSGAYTCNVVPHYTYVNLAVYYFEHHQPEQADSYAKKGLRIINRDFGSDSSMVLYKGNIIMILSYTDLPTALKFFRRQLPVCYTNECGFDMFFFYRGAYHLLRNLEKSGQKTVKLHFPWKDDPVFRPGNVYPVSRLKDYFYEKAKYLADRFDERNHNHHLHYLLQKNVSDSEG